jgi:predicted dienelactone hydrolase
MRVLRWFGLAAGFAFVSVVLLLALMWFDHGRETTLPIPSGTFPVGRTTLEWSDDAHEDAMAPQPGTKRELLAWIWYPAEIGQPAPVIAEYLPAPWREAVERQRGAFITRLLTRDLSRVHTHSFVDAWVSSRQPSYPVIVMRPGLSALTAGYATLAEDLASHGYIVVGIDAPYRSNMVVFPDGRAIARSRENNADLLRGPRLDALANRLVQAWSADVGLALDRMAALNAADPAGRFTGRLDLQHVGVFGHSLGGATALAFCHDDARCKAGVDVDGAPIGRVIGEGVSQPFMFLLSDHKGEAGSSEVEANIRSIFDHMPADGRWLFRIRGANHFEFSDDGALLKSPVLAHVLHGVGLLHLDGRRQLEITTHFLDCFFDVTLKGAPASELSGQGYPEVDPGQ